MAEHEPTENATDNKEIQIPEWDNAAVAKQDHSHTVIAESSHKTSLSARLGAVLPPHRRYFGLSRKVFLYALLAAILALLALIIGLAVGLTTHSG